MNKLDSNKIETTVEDIGILPLDHPGANDSVYKARRKQIARLAQDFRAGDREIPEVEYTKQEIETWKIATKKLAELHRHNANSRYLKSKDKLGIDTDRIPQLRDLNQRLAKSNNFNLQPIEGLIDTRSFLSMLERNTMLCTQYVRHHSNPEYTPEPDIIHEVVGHVPTFTNKEFLDFSRMIGYGARIANKEELEALGRLYWFTVEFGLIEEAGEIRAFGAGLLSSFGELQHCFSKDVERKRFNLKEVIDTDYDYSHMQSKLFIISSFEKLKKETEDFIRGFLYMKSADFSTPFTLARSHIEQKLK